MFAMTAHRYTTLPFACTRIGPALARTKLDLSDGQRSIELDLTTGAQHERRGTFAPSALRFRSEHGSERIEGRSCFADVTVERDAHGACVLTVSHDQRRLRLATDSSAALYTDDELCVCTTKTAAHFVAIRERSLASVSVALPVADERDLDMRREFAWILSGRTLLGVDVDTLAYGEHHACVALEYEAIAPASARDRRPAVAAMVLTSKLLLDHPGFGRLTLERKPSDPPLTKGERVSLDEVVEELPGIFRVRAWSRWTEENDHASATQRATLVLDAPLNALLTDR